MRVPLTMLAISSLIAAAACNRTEDQSAASQQQAPSAENVAAGVASPGDIAEVMRARLAHYKQMGGAVKGVGDQLQADAPDLAAIQRHAAVMAGFGPQMLQWFPEGSGAEAGRTRAKAEIWSDAQGFQSAVQRFREASARFDAAAKSGDLAVIRAAFPTLRSSCSNCHDRYRAPEE